MTEPNSMRLAILIDAENVQPVFADMIFQNAGEMGTICAREIFGAASALTTWVEPVLKYAIHPNLTIKAAKGKNSSDIALVIGAMDLVLGGGIDGVVIASSDSDFSSLSVRLRTAGLQVIGMGTEKANALWRTACSSFVVLEQASQKQAAQKQAAQKQPAQKQPQPKPAQQSRPAQQPPQQHKENNKPAANGHKERAAAIEQVIQKRLDSNGGRVQISTLFPILNRMQDYNIDRQGAGKKPLNYLTSTFGEAFDFEKTEDGNVWVSVKGWRPAETDQPAAEVKASAAEKELGEIVEAIVEPEETPEAVEALAEEIAEETLEPETPVEELIPDEPEETPDEETMEETPEEETMEETPDEEAQGEVEMATRMLIDGGMPGEIAATIVEILSTSADKRAAYNAIRKVYGSVEGRQYYNQAKEILENRGE